MRPPVPVPAKTPGPSPYRDEIDSLRERRETLATELDALRAQAAQLEDLRAREAEIAGELASVEGRLRGTTRRALPMLDRLTIASPCSAVWEKMVGDDRVRFCGACEKDVFNLSAMTREDAEALLRAKNGDVCVRFYERADGKVMTQDCPVGAASKRRRQRGFGVAAAGAMALAGVAAAAGLASAKQGGVRPPDTSAARIAEVQRETVDFSERATPPARPPRVLMGAPPPQHPY